MVAKPFNAMHVVRTTIQRNVLMSLRLRHQRKVEEHQKWHQIMAMSMLQLHHPPKAPCPLSLKPVLQFCMLKRMTRNMRNNSLGRKATRIWFSGTAFLQEHNCSIMMRSTSTKQETICKSHCLFWTVT